jgi:hypothetical protein
MTDSPRAPLDRCQSALHVALNACLDAIDAGDITPDVGQQIIDYTTQALGAAVLAGDVEVAGA